MKVIIIDDSRLARNELKRLLSVHSQIEILDEAGNAEEAKEKIELLKPELIFLDIQMPGKTGFDLLEMLEYIPKVIFTTAYDEYALKAFEFNALDYLLKPVDKSRLAEAILKSEQSVDENSEKDNSQYLSDQFFIKDGNKCWFVNINDIKYFETEGNYSKVFFENNSPLIPRSLNYLEERLDPNLFFRANRSQILNIKWIFNISITANGSLKVILKDKTEIEISRRKASVFKDLMSF